MSEILTYVELDIPFCENTYGIAPCNAKLAGDYEPVVAVFDEAPYLKRGGGLTGASDSKQLTASFWIKSGTIPVGSMIVLDASPILNDNTQRTCILVNSTGNVVFQGYNSASAIILDQRSAGILPGHWTHVLASFDLTNPAKCHIYLDDASAIASNVAFTNDTIDFTMADWGVGAYPGGGGLLNGSISDLWYAPGVYIDLSVEANRREFINADLTPVDLGATGDGPTGTAPLMFFSGDISAWHTNKGTGGGFTLVDAVTSGEFSTGSIKCFNSIKTCQDRESFNEGPVTLRFAKDTESLPRDIDALPFIESVSFTPAIVSLGTDLGQRATLSVTLRDAPHSDTGEGYDKYLSERDYDPFRRGTYWGKFRARQPFLRGRNIRWIRGKVGDDLSDMETRHFIVESFTGPGPDGKYTVVAKDMLKVADGDRSQAPVLSNGYLSADITAIATTAFLIPSGIGDEEYPAAGLACIGGNEVVSFTRSGDTMTIVRGQSGSVASAHKAQDRVQLVMFFNGADVADIIFQLLRDYADVPVLYMSLADWRAETAAFLGSVYTARVCEPTPVKSLISELVEQAALAIWWDDVDQQIRLQVLRAIVTTANTFTPENTMKGSLKIKEQPEKRLSRVQVYFGQIDPTKPLSNLDNYRSTSLSLDGDAEEDYGASSIKTILSRWIPEAGRSVADRLGGIQLGRYRDPPRQIQFDLMRDAGTDVELGGGYGVESHCVQDETGGLATVPVQVTRINPGPDKFSVEAEEMLWTAPEVDLANRKIVFNVDNFNVNLRSLHDLAYPLPAAGDVVTCTINPTVIIGSHNNLAPAFDVGSWPVGVTVNIIVQGFIIGAGGRGGRGTDANLSNGSTGEPGGTAFFARVPVNLDASAGAVWGGGGGGGGGGSGTNTAGGGGGGGAGVDGGVYGPPGNSSTAVGGSPGISGGRDFAGSGGPGTNIAGVHIGGQGGSGGGQGLPGSAGAAAVGGIVVAPHPSGFAGGAGGYAIDGISHVTLVTGDIRGAQVN